MNTDVETLPEGLRLDALAQIISKSKYNSFPIVNSDNRLTGILSFLDYSDALFNEHLKDLVVAKDLATLEVVTVSMEDNLFDALEKISRKDFSILPVVSDRDPSRLVGVLSRRDIIGAYDKAIIKKSLGRSGERINHG
jgi:CIC family chloride channel protein